MLYKRTGLDKLQKITLEFRPMCSDRGSALTLRSREAALASENVLLLVIGAMVVAGIAWFALRDAAGTEEEARAYADRTFHQLLFAHDAAYFDANLSASGRGGYPASQQRLLLYQLTKLGLPTAPVHPDGTLDYVEGEEGHFPHAHYEVTARYPTADAHAYLDITRHVGHWRIDYFTVMWQERKAPALTSGL